MDEAKHVQQDDFLFGLQVLEDQIQAIVCDENLLDVGRVVAEVDEGACGESSQLEVVSFHCLH